MKTFEQLTAEQQEKALDRAVGSLLEIIIGGQMRFNDSANNDNLQERIDAACAKAENMRTPWFAHEYIMDTCSEDIRSLAQCDAEDAIYLERGENAISGIL